MIWKTIPGYRHYEVSEYGDVRKGDHLMTPHKEPMTGRKTVMLTSRTGIKKSFKVARLVAMAFLGKPPFKGAHVCHNDGVEINDHFSNLRWDTNLGNHLDRFKHFAKHRPKGSRAEKRKLYANDFLQRHTVEPKSALG